MEVRRLRVRGFLGPQPQPKGDSPKSSPPPLASVSSSLQWGQQRGYKWQEDASVPGKQVVPAPLEPS